MKGGLFNKYSGKKQTMDLIKREGLKKDRLPGRVIQKAVGKDASSVSGKMTMGFARYSDESGPMEPHHHEEEIVYILSAKDGWARIGGTPDKLGDPVTLEAGMTLHFPVLEWHVFEFKPGGHVDIIFFYGQVEQIRPEEMKQ
ncbi:MAG: hypothetical protein MUO42_01570 [Anaerolineaceae bacterium]|nr:hypothetical protein [Anaerolineaceae bacterium]